MSLSASFTTIFTVVVLVLLMAGFVSGRFRTDMVALCGLLLLLLGGILTPAEALSGFSNPLIITIAGVFVVSGAVVRSGLAESVSIRILGVSGSNQNIMYMLVMLITAAVGSLVSNVGTVAIMMPIVASMARSIGVSSSRFLMPLAFMSSIGGMTTLIGNAANMVVNDLFIKAGYESLMLFSFLPVGLVALAFGILVLAPVTSYFLARRKNDRGDTQKSASLVDLAEKYHLGHNIYKILVPFGSTMTGRSLLTLRLPAEYGVVMQEVRRQRGTQGHFSSARIMQIAPDRNTIIQAGDVFYCMGALEQVEAMAADYGLKFIGTLSADNDKEKYNFEFIGICELVIMSASSLVNRSVAESSLRENFGITLLGIQRGKQYILEDLKDQQLQAGDALLVQGPWANLSRLAEHSRNWVVVGRPQEYAAKELLRDKIPFVSVVVLLMLAVMASGILPIVATVLLAALALGMGGVYRNVSEAYSTINMETLVMVACMLPMAIAMQKAGISGAAAEWITAIGKSYGPWAALALIYASASLLNIVISATPVALLFTPAAITAAEAIGVSPLPFIYAVAAGASLCFSSPISTPANALVMSAGRYTFKDYAIVGIPLQTMLGVIMVLVLPFLFPFHPA